MRSSIVQILFDLMGMMNLLVKFINKVNLKSGSDKASMVFVSLSLEARIFLEQLNAEIIAQRHLLKVDLAIEGFEDLRPPFILDNNPSEETILKLAYEQLCILIKNYSTLVGHKEIPSAMQSLLKSQESAFKGYAQQLQKINLS